MAKCHQCGKSFDPKKKTQRYCYPHCRQNAKKDRQRIIRRAKALARDIDQYSAKREWLGAMEQPVTEALMLISGKAEGCLDTLSYNVVMFDLYDDEGMNQ